MVGAHLSGLPLNPQLVRLGGRLSHRDRTAPAYRLLRLAGDGVPRPALVGGGHGAFAVEVWDLPSQGVGQLADAIAAPLGLGRVRLSTGAEVLGFVCAEGGADGARDVSAAGGWRQHLGAQA